MKDEKIDDENDGLWDEDSFIESVSQEELKEKMKIFHKKHDEDMNFNCKACNIKISSYNKDWHNCMCDVCFDKRIMNK